ncbi:MAG: PEP-CTERM sorting domain-containing protein [Bryobacterales bacterium]|nr:PEP-CTERM sorting domain-containing protein [Bryobacterales bacterium]
MMKLQSFLRIAVSALTLASLASAGPIFQRAMPTGPNVNAAGPNRSNIKWEPSSGGATFLGDDFFLNDDFLVTSLSVWMVANETSTTNPNQEMKDLSLYIGQDQSPDPSSVSFVSNTYSFSPGPFLYFNDVRGINQPIFKITFDNLAYPVLGNSLYNFGILGTPISPTAGFDLSLAGSNAALSVSQQDGPDGFFLVFDTSNGDFLGGYNSLTDALWDKESDINVEISGVPEPSTFALLLLGAGSLLIVRRRQR